MPRTHAKPNVLHIPLIKVALLHRVCLQSNLHPQNPPSHVDSSLRACTQRAEDRVYHRTCKALDLLRGRRESVDRLVGFDVDKWLEGGIGGDKQAVCESRDVVCVAAQSEITMLAFDKNGLKEAKRKKG
jgi:hypothetical protein